MLLPNNVELNVVDAVRFAGYGAAADPGLDAGKVGTFVSPREPDFRLDFLTTLHRGGDAPFVHAQLRVPLQPIRFIEYLLEDIQQTAFLSETGAVVANVPSPARYALHKLMVFGLRSGSHAAKAQKDLVQSASLIDCLSRYRPADIETAWKDILGRVKQWLCASKQGIVALEKACPDRRLTNRLPLPSSSKRTRHPR